MAWDAPVRVRHVGSGRYLAVDLPGGPAGAPTGGLEGAGGSTGSGLGGGDGGGGGDGELVYRVRLVDAAAADAEAEAEAEGEAEGGARDGVEAGRRARAEDMLFRVHCAAEARSRCVPLGNMAVRLEHHGTDPATGEARVLYLHSPGVAKGAMPSFAEAGVAAGATGATGGGGGREAAAGKGLRLVFSTLKSGTDVVKIMPAPAAECAQVCNVHTVTTP